MDTVSKNVRSKIMASVKGKNTSLELIVFRHLKKIGIRFLKHQSKLPGSPDAVIPQRKIAIFIDGDFWHGYRYPAWKQKIMSTFWREKIETNRKRDQKNFRKLRRQGWKVIRIWGHSIKNNPKSTIQMLEKIKR